jgi:nucleotide-binding universal stress UspA family protein
LPTYDITIRKILVAIDGSKPSLDASEQAISLAAKYEAELIAVHVVSPDVRYGYLEDVITPGLPASLKEVVVLAMEKGQKYLDNVMQNASENKVEVRTEVLIGASSVVKEIVEYAEEHKIDLIVIGKSKALVAVLPISKILLTSNITSSRNCVVTDPFE